MQMHNSLEQEIVSLLGVFKELTYFSNHSLLYCDVQKNGWIFGDYHDVVQSFEIIGKKEINRGLVNLHPEFLPNHSRELKHKRNHLGQL